MNALRAMDGNEAAGFSLYKLFIFGSFKNGTVRILHQSDEKQSRAGSFVRNLLFIRLASTNHTGGLHILIYPRFLLLTLI